MCRKKSLTAMGFSEIGSSMPFALCNAHTQPSVAAQLGAGFASQGGRQFASRFAYVASRATLAVADAGRRKTMRQGRDVRRRSSVHKLAFRGHAWPWSCARPKVMRACLAILLKARNTAAEIIRPGPVLRQGPVVRCSPWRARIDFRLWSERRRFPACMARARTAWTIPFRRLRIPC